MALKRQTRMMAEFSMASMTDVIFLLLIFFMVTSTFVFPTALEVNLPESSKQTAIKPSTRVYINKDGIIYATADDSEPTPLSIEQLLPFLQQANAANDDAVQAQAPNGQLSAEEQYIAVYADEEVTYGRLVEVLDLGAQNNMKMVLATKPAPSSARPN